MSFEFTTIQAMIGKVMLDVFVEKGVRSNATDDALHFECEDGDSFVFKHEHECSEDVEIVDICGELDDLIGSPILLAEESSNEVDGDDDVLHDFHGTWTFYRFGTIKGTVTVRWLGQSNGYYSEDVTMTHKHKAKVS